MISVGIACVPERLARAEDLKEQLCKWLPPTHVTIGNDKLHKGSWEGHRLAWLSYQPDSTFHLTLEDDVVLCDDFVPVLEKVVSFVDYEVISLYATRTHMAKTRWARRHGFSWYCDAFAASGQAVGMPVSLLKEFMAWERKCPPAMPYEDSRLWGWMYETGRYTWNTVPNLVDHALPTQSFLGFNSAGKVSGSFMEHGATEIDWSKGVAELKENPFPKKYEYGRETYMKWVGKYA